MFPVPSSSEVIVPQMIFRFPIRVTASPPTQCDRHRCMPHELAITRCHHIAHYSSTGRDRPALKLFCSRVEPHECVWVHAGFAIPKDAIDRGDPVRTRIRAARRRPLANGTRFRIKPAEISARVISIPDRTIARDCNAPWPASRVRQWVFVNLHRLWVDARKLVSAELCEKRNTV